MDKLAQVVPRWEHRLLVGIAADGADAVAAAAAVVEM